MSDWIPEGDHKQQLADQLADAVQRQQKAWQRSFAIDRREWSSQEWVNDAKRLFNEPDGAITSLVNGHIRCMLEELDRLGFPWSDDEDS